MLIEQVIEFQLKGPWPLGRSCTPTTGQFYDTTKISNENLRGGYYLGLKYCRRRCNLLLQHGPNHLQNLSPKCKILNVHWT